MIILMSTSNSSIIKFIFIGNSSNEFRGSGRRWGPKDLSFTFTLNKFMFKTNTLNHCLSKGPFRWLRRGRLSTITLSI